VLKNVTLSSFIVIGRLNALNEIIETIFGSWKINFRC